MTRFRLLRGLLPLFAFALSLASLPAQEAWKPAPTTLPTPWTADVSPDHALPEYPRPQMVRKEWMNLNGLWDYMCFDNTADKVERQGKILVPYPIESALSGVKAPLEPRHILVYRRQVNLPATWTGQRVLLHFGAVDWSCEVLVNGRSVGAHKGGYDAFSFDITDFLNPAGPSQEIIVKVTDPTDAGDQPIGKQRLRPDGIWYTATSGIWQTVWLEPVPRTFIRRLEIQPDLKRGRAFVRVAVGGDEARNVRVTARLLQGKTRLAESSGKSGTPLLLQIPNPRPWSPEDPFLYDLEVELGNGQDKVTSYLGLRDISVGQDSNGVTRLMLNDRFVFQLGPLDQGFFPDGLYTPPTEAAMTYDLETLRSLGFNMIRKHVKVEPERWYYLCDKMGFLVWQDMPSAANSTPEGKQQFMKEMQAMVEGLINHPSIIMWVPFNEGWGQYNTAEVVARIRQWDDSRLVNNASGWTDKQVGDVIDIHAYPGPAAPRPEAARAAVLGEFGGLGLNIRGHQWTSEGWGYELETSPEELLEKYEDLYRKLLPLVDTGGLSAAVYTQTSDIETENNGLMTYDRKLVKMDPGLLRLVHAGKMPPKPVEEVRMFHRAMDVRLAATAPHATLYYAIPDKRGNLSWLLYQEPISLRRTTTLHTRAEWPDSSHSRIQSFPFTKTRPVKGKGRTKGAPGLTVRHYDGAWDSLPDFTRLTPKRTFTQSTISLDSMEAREDYGLTFTGYLQIPATGTYTFHLASDDGSRLSLNGTVLIDNDGLHGLREKHASIVLAKGSHRFAIAYFQKKSDFGLRLRLTDHLGREVSMDFLQEN